MIVLDGSVLANVVGDDGPDGQLAGDLVTAERGAAIRDLADVETVAVLRRRWLAGTIDDARFEAAHEDLAALPFRRYPMLGLMRRTFEFRANVTAYDAAYLALAEAFACDLVTADARLARAPGLPCHVRTIACAKP